MNRNYYVILLICFLTFLSCGSAFATVIESDPTAPYGGISFTDVNTTLGQSFYVDTPESTNILESITTWIATEYDGTTFDFNIYNASDTTTSLFNTQLTLGYEFATQEVAITGINLLLDNQTDYIFTYTLTSSYLPYYYAGMAGTFGSDAYADGEYYVGFSTAPGMLFPASMMGMTADLQFQAELSHDSAPVPEPATLFLLGAGILGIAGITRKKNRI